MASAKDLLKQHDANMKEIADKSRGKQDLQRDLLRFLEKHFEEEAERLKKQGEGAPVESKTEELVRVRSEAQKHKKRKSRDTEPPAELDADGGHQPVRIQHCLDAPGDVDDPDKKYHRRFRNLSEWNQKHYLELFKYLEPSLFSGAVKPTDSKKGLRQPFG